MADGDPRPVSIKQMIGLAPEEAIRFLDAKGYRTSTNWDEVYQEEHVNAFTVAKIAKLDLLRSIHVSLLDAMAEGKTFAQWQAELRPELEAAGWWGKVADEELTGTAKPILVGPRRLRTIYDTNLRMARATALWDRIQAQKELLPYLRYSAVLDGRTRPLHRAWHGTILPVDHPWWQAHFPPNGWNCRCTVIQLSEAMMAQRGWTVTDPAPPLDDLVPFYRKATGEKLQVPRGIDPGFAYNPGIARLKALEEKLASSLGEAEAEGLEGVAAAAAAEIAKGPPPKKLANTFLDLGMRPTPVHQRYERRTYVEGRIGANFQEDRAAIEVYGGGGYRAINESLRLGMASARQAQIDAIDAAIANWRSIHDLALWRGIAAPDIAEAFRQTPVGEVVEDLGFLSTSLSRKVARQFSSGELLLKILVPKGANLYPMNGPAPAPHSHEREFLLPRGSKMIVRQVRRDYILMELVIEG